jgi:hypothetical protein
MMAEFVGTYVCPACERFIRHKRELDQKTYYEAFSTRMIDTVESTN